ncbi:WD40 repeat-containing protein [Cavenderia fasciculata]|uniref:WD40 repeat-containing protein n=1 Tax=Cavenderia fasciculata TaxID=261658 RepID=F4PLH8_CACFS|nr:WD40 repeat-containing protein [Cavenderia fasciculata]EGG23400.1 WD40 repeat-containing protein [Cavenderia fasciculata]|eukprot:XP_004361251.1 WD40 repeat-containing protein [Cavenderia fasciculata]
MVKSYLKYVQQDLFGTISTTQSLLDTSGKYAITGCGERIAIWNIRQGVVQRWLFEDDIKSEVSSVAQTTDGNILAAGYTDGAIRLWNLQDYSLISVLNGHRAAVTCLHFNKLGSNLVSGSRDTEIIIWDVITEAGLYRLRGHRDVVTQVRLLERSNHMISCSKDGLIKIWETETQHCVQTIVGHRNPIWSLDINANETRMVSCTSDSMIRVWRIHTQLAAQDEKDRDGIQLLNSFNYSVNVPINKGANLDLQKDGGEEDEEIVHQNGEDFAKYYGSIACKGESYSSVRFDSTNRVLICQSTARFMDIFSITPRKILEEQHRQKKQLNVKDEYNHTETVKTPSKIRGFSFGVNSHWNKLIVTLMGNSMVEYEIKEEGCTAIATLDQQGHRSDVRSLVMSTNDALLASTSSDSLKIWNAHEAEVWSIALMPDQSGLVSVSGDKAIKFWEFEIAEQTDQDTMVSSKKLTLTHTQTLAMETDVLSVKFSKDGRFLAVALLDNTVKLFYADTLKFHLSLYGHKLPVMTLDISDDSTLVVTGSADKNIRIWGLDYGDCHKSMFAHDDSIMQVGFIPKTHHAITVSKDAKIKIWDCDKFEQIQSIAAHHSEVWALAIGSTGTFFMTGSHDRSIRVFNQSQEPLFPESDKQIELEKDWELTLEDNSRVRTQEMLAEKDEHGKASKQTIDSVIAGEEIIEAMILVENERQRILDHERDVQKQIEDGQPPSSIAPFEANIFLFGKDIEDYLWEKVRKVRAGDLEESLMVLPFTDLKVFFQYCIKWLRRAYNVELISRCVFYLVQTHQNHLSISEDMALVLKELNELIKDRLQRQRDYIGFNRAAMGYLKREIEIVQAHTFFTGNRILTEQEEKQKVKQDEKKKKKIQEKKNKRKNRI